MKSRAGAPSAATEPLEALSSSGVTTKPTSDRRVSADSDPWLGSVIDGRYRVIEVIGRGGMGMVYKVSHTRMGKIAAMKVLHHEFESDDEVVARFRREADAVSRLHHPNSVQIFDFGMTEGALYLIMEFVRGMDLGTVIDRDGPLEFGRAAPLLSQICAALQEAHSLGIVHRDLKPENVLVTRTQRGNDFVKVLDFGLAKLSEQDELPDVTDRGLIVGTPYYMSPEQIRGDDVDARSDIYSLGALAYKLVTSVPPYTAKTPVGVLTKHLTADLVPPSERRPDLDIHPKIDAMIVRALQKQARDRYDTVSEFLDALEQIYANHWSDSQRSSISGLAAWSGMSRSATATKGVFDDEVDYGLDSDLRLRRSDLDAFERSIKRRRVVRIAIVPLLLLIGAAAIAYLFFMREPPTRTAERESNNKLTMATLIAIDSKVSGHIGRRIDKRTPDRDFYEVKQRPLPDGSTNVTVHVTALPNIDIEISLFDDTGQELAHANEAGIATDEWIRGFRISRPIYVLVTQALPQSTMLPTENVSDEYILTVSYASASPAREAEPNDSTSDATALPAGAPVAAFLDRRRDVDMFRFTGEPGKYELRIAGGVDLPLRWRIGEGKPSRSRSQVVNLARGDVLLVERRDATLAPGTTPPGRDSEYRISVHSK